MIDRKYPLHYYLFTAIFFTSGSILLISGIDTVDIWWANYVYYIMIGFMLLVGFVYCKLFTDFVLSEGNENV